MNETDTAIWYVVHFGLAALVVLIATAILEYITGEDA